MILRSTTVLSSLETMATKPVYKLGRTRFSVSHRDPAFEQVLARLLPHCDDPGVVPDGIYDVRMGYTTNITELFKQLVERHVGFVQINAACLTSPKGCKILISGGSNSGKSTIALALVFGHGWKVLAEHVTLVDPEKSEITSFSSPFCIKLGSRELIQGADITLPHFILHKWLPVSREHVGRDCRTPFDLVVHFDGEPGDAHLSCSDITAFNCLRKILPTSNLLKVPGGIEKLSDYLKGGLCYQFSNGSVRERVEKILELCAALDSRGADA